MWFKQSEQKSPQQPETPAPRPQQPASAPSAPVQPQEAAPATPPVAVHAPTPAASASRLTPGITLKGEISGKEDLWVGGNVDGKLRLESARIVVGASGKVHGEIEAREVVIEGKMEGSLRAAERLEITATGNVRGDAAAPRVALQEGAVFNGAMDISRPGEPRNFPQGSGSTSRTTVVPKGSRFQSAQAAGAAASGATSVTPAGTAPATPEAREKNAASTPSVLVRGIAADSGGESGE